jgi:hypothetical protein
MLVDSKFCLNCGNSVYSSSALCRHCGKPPHIDIAALQRRERRESSIRAAAIVVAALLAPLTIIAVFVLMVAPR